MLSNILALFPELFSADCDKRLSPTEAFCLVASIYLHDVGMWLHNEEYLKKYCSSNKISVTKMKKRDIFVRDNHHALSKFWILDSVSSHRTLPESYKGNNMLAPYIANICESHGIDFEKYSEYTDNEPFRGDSLRMGLLCTLLSLGDALDCDIQRIDYELLKNNDVPLDSRVHWMKHYYVNSIVVEQGRVKVYYIFPECDANISDVYKFYFKYKTMFWIEKCKEIRGHFLTNANVSYDIDFEIRSRSYKDLLSKEEFDFVKTDAISIVDKQILALEKLREELHS